ncbi:hypothetical protein [uncultured Succinivibrio sp.]|uniref:hypothetical protein n=1 Tax=uncultured Succinivibrio sp. TaxID=540749 RepID=UPI0025DE4634|nr:hypothetical protein [uncultured Succinivibrio sp.]
MTNTNSIYNIQKIVGILCILATLSSFLIFRDRLYLLYFNVGITVIMFCTHFFFDSYMKNFCSEAYKGETLQKQKGFLDQIQWCYAIVLIFVMISSLLVNDLL